MYQSKKRIYKIPQNGILATQFSWNNGWRQFPEYYYDEIGPEHKLPSFAEIRKIPVDTIVGLMGAAGTVKRYAGDKEPIEFSEFYIENKTQITEAQKKLEKIDITKLILN